MCSMFPMPTSGVKTSTSARTRNAGAAGRDSCKLEEFENRANLQAQRGISKPPAGQCARDERARDHELPDRGRVEGKEPTQEGKGEGHGSGQECF